MRKFILSTLSILLVAAITASMLVSCSGSDNQTGTPDTTVPPSVDTAEVDPLEERKKISDDLPDVDMDGYIFNVFATEREIDAFYSEEEIGEPVNDAMYYARRDISERFNADIQIYESGADDSQQVTEIKKLISADDSTYNMMGGHDVLLSNLSLDNYFVNLYSLPYQNFDKPWWAGIDELTFLDQCYLITSDISILGLQRTYVFYVNKSKMNDYGLEVPYQQVFDGTWTVDLAIELTKDVYEDLDFDGTASEGDFYGYISDPNCYGYLEAFGVDTLIKDGDTINIDFDMDRTTAIVSKIYQWLYETKGAKTTGMNNKYGGEEFKNGQALFIHEMVEAAERIFRFVEGLEYGILPVPKYDEAQENYCCTILHYPFVIPSTLRAADVNNTSIILEVLSAEGYKQVLPAYFEIALKQKYTTDDESIKTLDIIANNRRLTFSWAYENWKGFNLCLYHIYDKRNDNFASYYASNKKAAERQAKRVQESFEKMAETNI